MVGATTAEPKSRRDGTVERTPARRRRRGFRALLSRIRPVEAEALLILALFGLAMLTRWPYLLRLPHFTDEIGEIRWALRIYNGEAFPLTAQVQYFGPLHHYLLALCLWIFGPSMTLPRALACIIGALTVAMTDLIGRELGGGRTGAGGSRNAERGTRNENLVGAKAPISTGDKFRVPRYRLLPRSSSSSSSSIRSSRCAATTPMRADLTRITRLFWRRCDSSTACAGPTPRSCSVRVSPGLI